MCGIAGIACLRAGSAPPGREALLSMAGALEHRGPDERGIYRDERVGLAHTRLAIIDIAAGQQPMRSASADLWCVFNGEIFNHVELRAELEALGHVFRTRSDTEVVLEAWRAWREDAFRRMNGQWAIALWDASAHELVLSRDRVGVRPLFLAEHDGQLLFASEVRAIFAAAPTMRRALDDRGLAQTFTFWTSVAPASVFEGVHELPPGHVRTIRAREGWDHERAYWTPSPALEPFRGSIEDATVAVRDALERATALRVTRADVPVASYLSGGLDSSLVAALAQRATNGQLRTFSVRFEDTLYDEGTFQHEMARRLGSAHEEILVTHADVANAFPETVLHAERPLLRTAAAPLYLLSRHVRDSGIKVVLTGEGADEMFAGYDIFREAKVRRFMARRPASTMRPRLLERLYPWLARSSIAERALALGFFARDLHRSRALDFAHGLRWKSAAALLRLFTPETKRRLEAIDVVGELLRSAPDGIESWPELARDQYLEIRTLLSGYILSSQGDRMLMAHSVEGRFPFLDAEVMELAFSLPSEAKLRVLDEKHVVKRAARDLIAPSILARKKQPYRSPDAASFVGPDAPDWVEEVLSGPAVRDAGVFDPAAVAQLHAKCRQRAGGRFSNADDMALVGVLSTQILHRARVARAPRASAAAELHVDADRLARSGR